MRTIASIIAILFLLEPGGFGSQKRNLPKRGSAIPLVDPSKPAVFISFLRTGKVEPIESGVGKDYLWFQITNNTRWAIWLDMSGVPKEFGDAGLYYTIEDKEDNKIRIDSRCHACSVNPLSRGRSLRFARPRGYADPDSRLRIEYSFQWERESESMGGSYSTHSVEFYFSYLPKTVQL
jgi:hypothetical protein